MYHKHVKIYHIQVYNKNRSELAMQQKNLNSPQFNNQTNSNTTCQARLLGGTSIVECLMETIRCQWAASFRDGKICKHPSAEKFVNPSLN